MKGSHFNGVVVPGDEASEVPAPSGDVHTPSNGHSRVSSDVESPLVISDANVPVQTGHFIPLHSDTGEGGASDYKVYWRRGGGYTETNIVVPQQVKVP